MKRAASSMKQSGVDATIGRAEPELEWRAKQVDFLVADHLERVRLRLVKPRRGMEALTRRLEAQRDALDDLSKQVTPEAATDLEARKGHVSWLLNELRREL
jgi:hypothetical protein